MTNDERKAAAQTAAQEIANACGEVASQHFSVWIRMVRLLGDREAHLLTVLEAVSRATSLAEAQKLVGDELSRTRLGMLDNK
jgi:hypothetical protein